MNDLNEWILANNIKPTNKTTSSSSALSYEEKFEKILEYHINYVTKHPSHVELSNHRIRSLFERSDVAGFHYQEHVSGNGIEWDNDVVVIYGKLTKEWIVKEFKDGTQVSTKEGKGFNELLDELGSWHLILPSPTSPEYHVLQESTFADDFKLYETLFD